MVNIARGQITVNSLDQQYTFIRYSDDGKTFTAAKPYVENKDYGNGRNLCFYNSKNWLMQPKHPIYNLKVKGVNKNDVITVSFDWEVKDIVYNSTGVNGSKNPKDFQVAIQFNKFYGYQPMIKLTDKTSDSGHFSSTYKMTYNIFGTNTPITEDLIADVYIHSEAYHFKDNNSFIKFCNFMVVKGDKELEYVPAPEEQLFGLTQGAYIGTLIWDKPYPSDNVNDYIWSKTKGADAEFYKLNPLTEVAAVDKDGKLGVSLKYNVRYIQGANGNNINATTAGYYVRFRPNTSNTNTSLSTNTATPLYDNANYQTNYYKQSNKITYFTVELVKGNQILDTRVVTVILLPAATFDIKQATDTEMASIKARVISNESKIANNTKQITNNYTTLTQRADVIQSQAVSNKVAINETNGKVNANTNSISTLTQKANGIESRVGKIETFGDNIINDKEFFIDGDDQGYQSREYDKATDTYTFMCSDDSDDIDYGNSVFKKLDAGKYMLSFKLSVNGDDVRLALMVRMYASQDWQSASVQYDVIRKTDLPQHRLYTYEFTVTKDKPYLWLYLESDAPKKTLPWIIKMKGVRLLKITESESVIRQTVDDIVLDADKVKIVNKGKLAALFQDGKIKADYLEANTGVFKINQDGFYYEGKTEENKPIETKIYNNGFSTRVDETINKSGAYQKVTISPYSKEYNLSIVSGSEGAVNIESVLPDIKSAMTITDGTVSGLRKDIQIVNVGVTKLHTYASNIIVAGDRPNTLLGVGQTTLVLPDMDNLTNGLIQLGQNNVANRLAYYKKFGHYPETLQVGQEYTVFKRSKGELVIKADTDTQSYYSIAEYVRANNTMQINDKEQITIPSDWCGIVKILFDGYFWNLYKY